MTGCFSISSTIRWISTWRCRSRSRRSAPASRRWRGCRRGNCGWRRAFSMAAGSASSCRMSIRPRRRGRSRRPCATRRWGTVRSPAACRISAMRGSGWPRPVRRSMPRPSSSSCWRPRPRSKTPLASPTASCCAAISGWGCASSCRAAISASWRAPPANAPPRCAPAYEEVTGSYCCTVASRPHAPFNRRPGEGRDPPICVSCGRTVGPGLRRDDEAGSNSDQMLPRIFGQRSISSPVQPEIVTPLRVAAGSRHDALRGILLMCAGVAMFPFMNAAVKLLGAHYPVAQIVWARFTGHLIVMLLVFLPQYGRRLLATRRPAVQIGRSLLMLVSNMMFVVAITRVPLATASAIGFTSPLIVTALSVPILHESVGIRRWSAVVIGFAGALLVIRPGAGLHDLAVLLLLLSSGAYALYQIATRWVSFYDDAAIGIIFTALLGWLVMTATLPFVFVMPRSALDILLFASLGLLGGAGHYLVIRAFQSGPAAVIAPLGYVELIGTTILGYAIFGDFPDLWTWIGAAIIIASGLYIAFRERHLRGAR